MNAPVMEFSMPGSGVLDGKCLWTGAWVDAFSSRSTVIRQGSGELMDFLKPGQLSECWVPAVPWGWLTPVCYLGIWLQLRSGKLRILSKVQQHQFLNV